MRYIFEYTLDNGMLLNEDITHRMSDVADCDKLSLEEVRAEIIYKFFYERVDSEYELEQPSQRFMWLHQDDIIINLDKVVKVELKRF